MPSTIAASAPVIRQAQEPRSRRVESLRALAAIGVVEYHVLIFAEVGRHSYSQFDTEIARIGIGTIDLFFALSGYLMFRPFARRDFAGGSSVNLKHYALNRAVRLLPIYYLAMIILLIVEEHGGTAQLWLRFLTFTQSLTSDTSNRVDPPTWTLVVELQFYITLPLIAWGIARLSNGSAATAALMLAAMVAVSYLYHDSVRHQGDSPAWLSYPSNFLFIGVGMLVGLVEVTWQRGVLRKLPSVLLLADVWLVGGALLWPLTSRYDWSDLVGLVAVFLIVGSVILPLRPGRAVRLLDWRPLATLGLATYSLYIWHLPLLNALVGYRWLRFGFAIDTLITLVLASTAALLSYRFIESRFLRLRRRWAGTTVEAEVGRAAPG
jgi:peptidoglycan/LPS O-acetylase OafA/YrhL